MKAYDNNGTYKMRKDFEAADRSMTFSEGSSSGGQKTWTVLLEGKSRVTISQAEKNFLDTLLNHDRPLPIAKIQQKLKLKSRPGIVIHNLKKKGLVNLTRPLI